jgi:transposase
VSLCYWILRRLLELAVLALRSEGAKEIEIVLLRHQLHVLRRQVKRPDLKPHDRALIAAASRSLPKGRRASLLVRPETILRWHSAFVSRRWTYPRSQGRPSTAVEIRQFVVRLAKENATLAYRRIQGELKRIGIAIAPSTVWSILKREGIDPAPRRKGPSWKEFLRSQAEGIIACDFVAVDTAFLRRFYALLFIEIATRSALGGRDVQTQRLLGDAASAQSRRPMGHVPVPLPHPRPGREVRVRLRRNLLNRGTKDRPHPDQGAMSKCVRRAVCWHSAA